MKYGIYILSAFGGLAAGVGLGAFMLFKTEIEPITATLNMEGESLVAEAQAADTEEVAYVVKELDEEPLDLPDSVQLNVPFTSQAPEGNWGMPYQEACEEASLIMAYNFYEKEVLSPLSADAQINSMVSWENTNLGFYKDTNIEQTARIAEEYYGYSTSVTFNPTVKDIKKELAAGNPVIIPSAGRELDNPNFTDPGPWYHMLVITGYDGDTFTTNDPGTRNGEDFVYQQDVLMEAIHDFPGVKEQISTGDPAMLVIKPIE